MTSLKAIAAAICLLAAAQAHAISFNVTRGAHSLVSGVSTDTFDRGASIDLDVSGGRFSSKKKTADSRRPKGAQGQWWSVGATSGPGVVKLDASATYYGLLWGSPESFNTVSFFNDGALVDSFDGSEVFALDKGRKRAVKKGQYLNFTAGVGEVFDEVRFSSARGSFETDNHSVLFAPSFERLAAPVPEPEADMLVSEMVDEMPSGAAGNPYGTDNPPVFAPSVGRLAAPVPEPESYLMMLMGLGVLSAMVRRRRAG